MRSVGLALGCMITAIGLPVASVRAQPAWIVTTGEAEASTPASTLVLLRHADLTVATLALDYVGDDAAVAIVWPLPGPTDLAHVHAVPGDVIDRVDLVSAPRLVERWERDPCSAGTRDGETGLARPADMSASERLGTLGTIGHGSGTGTGYGYGVGSGRYGYGGEPAEHGASLTRGDFEVTVLSPEAPDALVTWLTEHGYRVPGTLRTQAAALGADTFVVARLEHPSGHLPPLRVSYRAPTFRLPLVESSPHDLVALVLTSTRVDVHADALSPPTGVALAPAAATHFADVYAAVLERLFIVHPGAVITEHAWSAASCEGCAGGRSVRASDLATLGGALAFPEGVIATRQTGRLVSRRLGAPTLTFGTPTVHGELTPEMIRRTLRRYAGQSTFCYEQGLQVRPDLAGRVDLMFVVGPTGAVIGVQTQSTTVNDASVESCLGNVVRRCAFPAPSDGTPAQVVVSYRLESTSRPDPEPTAVGDWVLTRLHARVGSGEAGWWELGEAEAIEGGREHERTDPSDDAVTRPRFQTRYVVRHPWDGELACDTPVRDVWGAPATGQPPDPVAATRDGVAVDDSALGTALTLPLDQLGLAPPPPPQSLVAEPPIVSDPVGPIPTVVPTEAAPHGSSCDCRAIPGARADSCAFPSIALALLVAASRRRMMRP